MDKACTFFGHRECPESVKPKLREVLVDLITNHDVLRFYVGNQGQFDAYVRSVLRELKTKYPQIDYAVVLAYMPGKKDEYADLSDTMLPEEIASIPPRYAIDRRNKWMLKHSDYVVSYITHSSGGAAKYTEIAKTQKTIVLNLQNR